MKHIGADLEFGSPYFKSYRLNTLGVFLVLKLGLHKWFHKIVISRDCEVQNHYKLWGAIKDKLGCFRPQF